MGFVNKVIVRTKTTFSLSAIVGYVCVTSAIMAGRNKEVDVFKCCKCRNKIFPTEYEQIVENIINEYNYFRITLDRWHG